MNSKPNAAADSRHASSRAEGHESGCPSAPRGGPSPEIPPNRFIRMVKMVLGSLILRVCPEKPHACANVRCHLRPLCACAAAELRTARQLEGRVWITVAACGLIALALWLSRGLLPSL